MSYDIIIIGGGLGGLVTGAKLSREGKRVLLIEQHDRPGGYATTFQRKDYTLEVGLHEMDGPTPGDMKTRIFNDLDVFKNVEFLPLPEFYRFVHNQTDVTIPHDPLAAEEKLSGLFPGESAGVKAYFDLLLKRTNNPAGIGESKISIGDFLDSVIRDEELKLILLGNLGYFHDDPYDLSLSYYALAQGSYYSGGASFIKGGSQRLSDHLAGFIRNHGGEVLLNHLVTGITVEYQWITGVRYQRSRKPEAGNLEASAETFVVNMALPNVVSLLRDETAEMLRNELQKQKPGASLLTVYLGFKKPLKELGHQFYSTAVFSPDIKTQKDIFLNNHADYDSRSFMFVDYGQVDSGLAPAGKSVGAICCTDYLEYWENLERKSYLSKKKQVATLFIERLEQLIPGIRDILEYQDVGTPATLKRYTLNPHGAVYGFARSPDAESFETSKLPENLHIASAWGKTGGGYSGAIYGGYLCALNILRKRRG